MSKKPVKPVLKVSEQELKKIVQAEVREEVYSGPLPHPEHLKKYDEVYPGAAKIIIETFVKQYSHRLLHLLGYFLVERKSLEKI